MAEWLKAAVLKTVEGSNLPGVRLPLSPLFFLHVHVKIYALLSAHLPTLTKSN